MFRLNCGILVPATGNATVRADQNRSRMDCLLQITCASSTTEEASRSQGIGREALMSQCYGNDAMDASRGRHWCLFAVLTFGHALQLKCLVLGAGLAASSRRSSARRQSV